MTIEDEFPINLGEVPKVIKAETGEEVSFKTVYRWATRGKRGIRLELKPGIRKRTSREAVLRFLARLAARDKQREPAEISRAAKRRQAAETQALAAVGW